MNGLHRWRRLLAAERWGRWVLVLLLAVIVSGVEALGAVLVFLLLGLIAAPEGPLEVPLFGDLRQLLPIDQSDLVVWLAAGVAVFFLIRGLLVMLEVYVQDRLAHNAGARLAVRLLRGYLAMPYALHLQRDSSELIRNTFESVRALTHEALIPAVRMLSNVVLAAGMLVVLVYAAPLATAAAVVLLVPVVWLLVRVIHPRLKRLGRERQAMSRENLRLLQQSLHGIREVTLFGRADYFRRRFAARQMATARISYLNRVAQEVPRVLMETVLVVFIAGFFVVSVTVQGSPQHTLAILGLFAYAALRLQPALHKIVQSMNSIRFAGAAIDNVVDDLELVDAHAARTADTTSLDLPVAGADPPDIRLEAVAFHYTPDGPPVLHGIDLHLPPRSSLGIVGPTGGGKSTLLDVVTGLLHPTDGRVLIDGRDLRTCTAWWQAQLGVVPQTIFLIDDTLRRNIALGVPDDQIDEDRVVEAVALAQLTGFVEALPDGLATTVGERGIRLSGGQRQRVAIARALYRQPSVLVFDEGTSALDGVTEAELIASLDGLRGHHTLILVAHRLTTVRHCDRIIVVEDGRIADTGTYADLAERNDAFRRSLFGAG